MEALYILIFCSIKCLVTVVLIHIVCEDPYVMEQAILDMFYEGRSTLTPF